MKNTGFLFALMGTFLCLILQTACTDKKPPVKTLATATQVISGRCPEMVDQETQLDSVVLSPEGQLAYYYTMLYRDKRGMNTNALKGFLIPSITNNVRENPDLRMHRDSSVTMVFNYRDRKGEFVMDIIIEAKDYQ